MTITPIFISSSLIARLIVVRGMNAKRTCAYVEGIRLNFACFCVFLQCPRIHQSKPDWSIVTSLKASIGVVRFVPGNKEPRFNGDTVIGNVFVFHGLVFL